jgi:hypothetical protein
MSAFFFFFSAGSLAPNSALDQCTDLQPWDIMVQQSRATTMAIPQIRCWLYMMVFFLCDQGLNQEANRFWVKIICRVPCCCQIF